MYLNRTAQYVIDCTLEAGRRDEPFMPAMGTQVSDMANALCVVGILKKVEDGFAINSNPRNH